MDTAAATDSFRALDAPHDNYLVAQPVTTAIVCTTTRRPSDTHESPSQPSTSDKASCAFCTLPCVCCWAFWVMIGFVIAPIILYVGIDTIQHRSSSSSQTTFTCVCNTQQDPTTYCCEIPLQGGACFNEGCYCTMGNRQAWVCQAATAVTPSADSGDVMIGISATVIVLVFIGGVWYVVWSYRRRQQDALENAQRSEMWQEATAEMLHDEERIVDAQVVEDVEHHAALPR